MDRHARSRLQRIGNEIRIATEPAYHSYWTVEQMGGDTINFNFRKPQLPSIAVTFGPNHPFDLPTFQFDLSRYRGKGKYPLLESDCIQYSPDGNSAKLTYVEYHEYSPGGSVASYIMHIYSDLLDLAGLVHCS